MNTFSKIWPEVFTPEDAKRHIDEERKEMEGKTPQNLEEQAISLVGRSIYEKLIKNYTEKQWHRDCKDLPADIIKRLPVRFIYDNNYFNDRYQGIPIGGYTKLVEKMLDGIEVRLDTNFFEHREELTALANKIIYTGMLDEYFNFKLGHLEYRSLRFETVEKPINNYQGNAVVNYTGDEVDYTRVIEHKHFEYINNPEAISSTIITYEYPDDWDSPEKEAFYAINDERNNALAEEYRALASKESNVIFGGRLADYRYYDMDDVIKKALETEI
jgi:UDP-galactopyranose mutase